MAERGWCEPMHSVALAQEGLAQDRQYCRPTISHPSANSATSAQGHGNIEIAPVEVNQIIRLPAPWADQESSTQSPPDAPCSDGETARSFALIRSRVSAGAPSELCPDDVRSPAPLASKIETHFRGDNWRVESQSWIPSAKAIGPQ